MIDDELRALVSVDPTPGWEARVRSRVAADRSVAASVLMRNVALAAAAVVAVAVGASLWSNVARNSRSTEPAALNARAFALDGWTLLSPPAVPAQPALPALPAAPALPTLPALPARGAVQVDPREARALRELFATAPALSLPLPEPRTGPIVVPEIAIEPIANSNTEGARQ
jgi:hypothetical protein